MWSTWNDPGGLLSEPRRRGPRRWHGVERQAAVAHMPKPPASPLRGARPERACAQRGLHGLCTGPAHSLAATRQRPSSAPLHQPSPSTVLLFALCVAEPWMIGADLMELSPPHDENARTAKLAARLLLEVLSARG